MNGGGAEHPRSERWCFPCLFCGTQVTRVRILIWTEGVRSTPRVRGGASPAYSAVPKSQELSAPFERRGWGALGRGELGVAVFFLILPFALLNSSEIKWVWHLRKLQFVIARFSELLIHGNILVFTIEIMFSKIIGWIIFDFMEQVSVRVMKRIIILYIPHYIQKFIRI